MRASSLLFSGLTLMTAVNLCNVFLPDRTRLFPIAAGDKTMSEGSLGSLSWKDDDTSKHGLLSQ